LTITWTESAYILGKTAESTKESIKMIKSTVSESMFGLTAEYTEVTGQKGNNTALVYILFRIKVKSMVFGRRERE